MKMFLKSKQDIIVLREQSNSKRLHLLLPVDVMSSDLPSMRVMEFDFSMHLQEVHPGFFMQVHLPVYFMACIKKTLVCYGRDSSMDTSSLQFRLLKRMCPPS